MVSPQELISTLPDPEIPVISIADLGLLRSVEEKENGTVVVTVTPTYSGCPALDQIRNDIASVLHEHGYQHVEVRTALRPAWTTDWISAAGRELLREFGIAPPRPRGGGLLQPSVPCPRCGSASTRLVSRFGSTPCKAHRICNSCQEPFDHFKEH
jgi:ring-1,2-phenylacetyl-CoA epoxidase subunit PaaD